MNFFTFDPEGTGECQVKAWLQPDIGIHEEEKARPAVIICPGGGYEYVSVREAEPVAKKLYGAGYHCFILNYSTDKLAKDFKPLKQLALTMRYLRENAAEWKLDENRVAVAGFSAGGHLAASLGTLYNTEKFLKVCPDLGHIRPDAMVLSYPVIRSDALTHEKSIRNVSGEEVGSEEYKWFGLEQHVDSTTPPTFIWHTVTDDIVPVENSLAFIDALAKEKVYFESHILPSGYHGMVACTKEVGSFDPYNGRWLDWAITWLNRVFEYND